MKKRLTEVAVTKRVGDRKGWIEAYDQVTRGLMLCVTPHGKKSESMVYRVTTGNYSRLNLEDAQAHCRKAIELVLSTRSRSGR